MSYQECLWTTTNLERLRDQLAGAPTAFRTDLSSKPSCVSRSHAVGVQGERDWSQFIGSLRASVSKSNEMESRGGDHQGGGDVAFSVPSQVRTGRSVAEMVMRSSPPCVLSRKRARQEQATAHQRLREELLLQSQHEQQEDERETSTSRDEHHDDDVGVDDTKAMSRQGVLHQSVVTLLVDDLFRLERDDRILAEGRRFRLKLLHTIL
jgi:hypothetical protein